MQVDSNLKEFFNFKSENVLPRRFYFAMKYTARLQRGKEYLIGNQGCMEK